MSEKGNLLYELDRELYQDTFVDFLGSMGFSNYGIYEGNKILGKYFDMKVQQKFDEYGDYTNDVFSITPECWCMIEGGCVRCHKTNFHYKPTDFKLNWYKYPLRGNECNREINAEEFLRILNHCRESFYQ